MSNEKWMSLFQKDEKNLKVSLVKAKEKVATPSPSLNWALSGGFYKGYSTMLYGPNGSGKSLISMIAAGSLMQSDPDAIVVLVSTEMRQPVADRVKALGVNPENLMVRLANDAHDVFDWIESTDERFVNSDGSKGGPGLRWFLEQGAPIKGLIIDSVKGIISTREAKLESVSKEQVDSLSKLLNVAFRRIVGIIRKYDLMTILVQQVNDNLNPDEVKYQNKKYVIPSGHALKHFVESYALIEKVESKDSKLFDTAKQSIRELPVQLGHTVRVRVEKANLDKPSRDAEFQIDYSLGVVNVGAEVANLAANLGIITHPLNDNGKEIINQWVFGDRKWIGFQNAVDEAEESPELRRELMSAVYDLDKPTT